MKRPKIKSECKNVAYNGLFKTDKRFVIAYGGAGAGKSYAVAQRLIELIIQPEICNILVIRKIADTNRGSTFNLLIQIIRVLGIETFFTVTEASLSIKYKDSTIVFAGLDKVDK